MFYQLTLWSFTSYILNLVFSQRLKGTYYADFWISFSAYFPSLQYSALQVPTALASPNSDPHLNSARLLVSACLPPSPCYWKKPPARKPEIPLFIHSSQISQSCMSDVPLLTTVVSHILSRDLVGFSGTVSLLPVTLSLH